MTETVVAARPDGAKLVAVDERDGYVLLPDGGVGPIHSILSITARGYWKTVRGQQYHMAGQHDQKSHGRGGGGAAAMLDAKWDGTNASLPQLQSLDQVTDLAMTAAARGELLFVRYSAGPEFDAKGDFISHNWAYGTPEAGLSAVDLVKMPDEPGGGTALAGPNRTAQAVAAYSHFTSDQAVGHDGEAIGDMVPYVFTAKFVGRGSDGEPVVSHVKPVARFEHTSRGDADVLPPDQYAVVAQARRQRDAMAQSRRNLRETGDRYIRLKTPEARKEYLAAKAEEERLRPEYFTTQARP